MKELTEMEIAAAAYTEYSRITGGKSLATGQPLPLWCDLPDNIRYAWHGTIYKVVCLVLNQDEIQTSYHDGLIAENKKLNEALERIESIADEDWENGAQIAAICREVINA